MPPLPPTPIIVSIALVLLVTVFTSPKQLFPYVTENGLVMMALSFGLILGWITTSNTVITPTSSPDAHPPQSQPQQQPPPLPKSSFPSRSRSAFISLTTTTSTTTTTPNRRIITPNSPEVSELAFGLPPVVAKSLSQFVDLAVRDFVCSWYSQDISHNNDFVHDATFLILDCLGELLARISCTNIPLLLLQDVSPILERTTRRYNISRKLAHEASPRGNVFSNADMATISQREAELLRRGFKCHPGSPNHVEEHIRLICHAVLMRCLSDQDRNCLALMHLVREISVIKIVCEGLKSLHPHLINSLIVASLSSSSTTMTTPPSPVVGTVAALSPLQPPPSPSPLSLQPTPPSPIASDTGSTGLPIPTTTSTVASFDDDTGPDDVLELLKDAISDVVKDALETGTVNGTSPSYSSLISSIEFFILTRVLGHNQDVATPSAKNMWPFFRRAAKLCGPDAQAAVHLIETGAAGHPAVSASGVDIRTRAFLAMAFNHRHFSLYLTTLLEDARGRGELDDDLLLGQHMQDKVVEAIQALDLVEFSVTLDFFWHQVRAMDLTGNVIEDHFLPQQGDAIIRIINVRVSDAEVSLAEEPEFMREFSGNHNPRPHVDYVVTVTATQGEDTKQWSVRRRYRLFERLHYALQEHFPTKVNDLTLPKKRGMARIFLASGEFDRDFISHRTKALSRYLECLCEIPEVANSLVMRRFLGCANTITHGDKGMDESFLHAITLYDDGESSSSSSNVNAQPPPPPTLSTGQTSFLHHEHQNLASVSSRVREDAEGNLLRLVDEAFQLKQGKFSFLRRNIVSLARAVVKTSFKGKIYETIKSAMAGDGDGGHGGDAHKDAGVFLAKALDVLRDVVWPNGVLANETIVIPCETEQEKVRREALKFLKAALPGPVIKLMGKDHADFVAESVHDMILNPMIINSLVLDVTEVLVTTLFPDIVIEHELRMQKNNKATE